MFFLSFYITKIQVTTKVFQKILYQQNNLYFYLQQWFVCRKFSTPSEGSDTKRRKLEFNIAENKNSEQKNHHGKIDKQENEALKKLWCPELYEDEETERETLFAENNLKRYGIEK